MHKFGRLKNPPCLLFYTFANIAILSKCFPKILNNFVIARLLYFADVFFSSYTDKVFIFLQTFPLYMVLLAALSYELSITELMLLARASLRVQLSQKYVGYNRFFKMFIYVVMCCFCAQFTVSYIRVAYQSKSHISYTTLSVFYLLTGVLIDISSIHFICEMKRNFGHDVFVEAKQNVRVIFWTITVGFTYSLVVMVSYGTDLFESDQNLIITLCNLQFILGEILPLFVVMRIHRTMMLMSQPVEYIQDFQAEQSTEEQLSVTSDSLLGTKDPLKDSNQSTDKIKTHSDTNSLILSLPYR